MSFSDEFCFVNINIITIRNTDFQVNGSLGFSLQSTEDSVLNHIIKVSSSLAPECTVTGRVRCKCGLLNLILFFFNFEEQVRLLQW